MLPTKTAITISIVEEVRSVLKESKEPLMAKQIAAKIREKAGLKIARQSVNSVLYGELRTETNRNSKWQWELL